MFTLYQIGFKIAPIQCEQKLNVLLWCENYSETLCVNREAPFRHNSLQFAVLPFDLKR